jgi:hypothetical protein
MVTSSFLKCSQGLKLEAFGRRNQTNLQNETGPPMKDGPLAIKVNITLISTGSKQIIDIRVPVCLPPKGRCIKVLQPEAARRLVSVDRNIRLTGLETVAPCALARDLILQHPDHIVLLDCPCHRARPNPSLPLDVCPVIGEPFAGFIAEHRPARNRWIWAF